MKDRLDIYLLCLVPEKNDRIMVAECDKVSTDAKHCSELLAPRSSAWKSNKNKKITQKFLGIVTKLQTHKFNAKIINSTLSLEWNLLLFFFYFASLVNNCVSRWTKFTKFKSNTLTNKLVSGASEKITRQSRFCHFNFWINILLRFVYLLISPLAIGLLNFFD